MNEVTIKASKALKANKVETKTLTAKAKQFIQQEYAARWSTKSWKDLGTAATSLAANKLIPGGIGSLISKAIEKYNQDKNPITRITELTHSLTLATQFYSELAALKDQESNQEKIVEKATNFCLLMNQVTRLMGEVQQDILELETAQKALEVEKKYIFSDLPLEKLDQLGGVIIELQNMG